MSQRKVSFITSLPQEAGWAERARVVVVLASPSATKAIAENVSLFGRGNDTLAS